MKHMLHIGIGDAGIAASLRVIATLDPFRNPPLKGDVDDRPIENMSKWTDALLTAKRDGRADWFIEWESHQTAKMVNVYPRSGRITLQLPDAFATASEGFAWIASLPFEICSMGTIFLEEWNALDVPRVGFGRRHCSHGWACAFRGQGHDRLVSRRWLDFGPWRAVRRPGDLTLIQFHDIDADAETARDQAQPGHQRMGISASGGFLQIPYPFVTEIKGLYLADRRTLEIIVPPGGQIEQISMLDACAVRYQHRMAPPEDNRIERIAYVFVDEADARAHLHELWLRELEVWLVDGEGKRRLDDTYQPAPVRPEWVADLERRSTV